MMKQSKSFSRENVSWRAIFRFKWGQWKSDYRVPLLSLVEIILSVGIAAAIAIYLDPDWNVVAFPWNVTAFLILVGMAIWVHRQTRPFRVARRLNRKKKLV